MQGLLHLVEKLLHSSNRDTEVHGLKSLFDDVASTLPLDNVRNLLQHFFTSLTPSNVLMPEGYPEAQDCDAGVMDILVQLLRPQPYFDAAKSVRRHQCRTWKLLVQILVDDVRFLDDDIVMLSLIHISEPTRR